jgi:ABC-type nitrate/sulfonate/bicarbonate transport system permease component
MAAWWTMRKLRPLIGVVALLAAWWALAAAEFFDPVLLPTPGAAAKALVESFASGGLVHDFEVTIYRTATALAIASVIAIPLGIVLGSNEEIYRSLEFVVDFFRSTPTSAMFPLFLVLFGVGDRTKIAVAAFGCALVVLFNVAYGVINSRKTRVLAAQVMGASRARVLFDVYLWESLPQTFVGMRNGVSLALVIVIVAEMFIGSTDGLGRRLIDAQMTFDMPTMYATIFASGALGYGLNWLFLLAEKKFVHWGGK